MKFLVKQQKIEALEREVIASDQIAFVSVKFVFDGAWKTLHKVVQFTQCEETYNVVLGTEGTTCLATMRKAILHCVQQQYPSHFTSDRPVLSQMGIRQFRLRRICIRSF